jgi:hypothetical protein
MHRFVALVSCTILTAALLVSVARGEISGDQQAQVAALKTAIDQAARLFKQEKFTESAAEVAKCQTLLARTAAGADAEMLTALEPAHARLRKAHTLFAVRGISLPALSAITAPSNPSAEVTPRTPDATPQPTGEISFTQNVAPILVARCGMCHVGRNMGQFSMATFASLMQGSENGQMIEAGLPDESTLVMLVETGDMPPPRPRPRPVPKDEVQVLKDWVAQGAKFDGADEEQPLLEIVPPEVARAARGRGGRGGGGPPQGRRGQAGSSRPAR